MDPGQKSNCSPQWINGWDSYFEIIKEVALGLAGSNCFDSGNFKPPPVWVFAVLVKHLWRDENLRHLLKMFIATYFVSSNTPYALLCINMHSGNNVGTTAEANIHHLPYHCYWGLSQSVTRKMNGALRLADLETPANIMSSVFQLCIYFTYALQKMAACLQIQNRINKVWALLELFMSIFKKNTLPT